MMQPAHEEKEEERHNFALAKDGAKIVAANKEARKSESILDSDGDTFLKNECKADKWIIVELSQVAKVDLLRFSQVIPYPRMIIHPLLCLYRLVKALHGKTTIVIIISNLRLSHGVQYELYSSRVRDFELYGRQSHPRSDGSDYARNLNASSWELLGQFTAANVKGTQVGPLGHYNAGIGICQAC